MATEEAKRNGLTRRQAVGWITVGGATIALPKFLHPSAAAAQTGQENADAMALFLGQDRLPVPPENAKRYTTACQFCNVGCGYIVYTWPVDNTPDQGSGLLGGEPGELGVTWVRRRDGRLEELAGADQTILEPGEAVIVRTPTGGGYGSE